MADVQRLILKPTLGAVYDILNMQDCRVGGIQGIPKQNKLNINPGRFDLEFDATYRAVHPGNLIENLPELTVYTANATYTIPKYNANFEGSIVMGGDQAQHFDMRFSRLTQDTLALDRAYYWRFVYPINNSEWFLKVGALPYMDDFGTSHAFNLILSDLDGHTMKLFANNAAGLHWMMIDCTEPITHEEMDCRVMSIITALGFVLGRRYGDYCFHIASDVADFSQVAGVEALALQRTRYCPFKILHTDNNIVEIWLEQHDYQQYALDELKGQQTGNVRLYYNDDASLTMDAFSKLSQLCYKSNDMLLSASMLVDGSMMNIEYQKPFFHVTLETITSVLMANEDMLPPPTMPQEDYKQDVLPILLDALESIPNLSADALRVFSQRIGHNLNTAPNASKLEACFPKYGYTLTAADKEAIRKRNSTFHGHLTNENTPLRAQQNDLFAMSLRLHKLCSILLLKAAGFQGKVINNEVLFGMKGACEREESVYLAI